MATAKLVHVDAIQTAPPGKVTPPGQARRISTAAPLGADLLQNRFQVVLYYNKAEEEESALEVAAWIKESLSAALPDHPVLSGRLRRENESGGYWEVKFNDSGVRLVQATAEVTMSEFLSSKDRDGREAQLAYWEDIDKGSPNFSALFYIQVTQFQADGYSIGISCSLFLADPLFLSRFLKSWARTHTQIMSQEQLTKYPMFHLNYFRRPVPARCLKSIELESNLINSTTMLFKVSRNPGAQSYDAIALACLQEATRRLEAKPVSSFSLMISNHSGDLRVESCTDTSMASADKTFDVIWWDQLGMEEIDLSQGSKHVHVSCRIVSSCVDEGLVVVMVPSDEESVPELMISVTVPKN